MGVLSKGKPMDDDPKESATVRAVACVVLAGITLGLLWWMAHGLH